MKEIVINVSSGKSSLFIGNELKKLPELAKGRKSILLLDKVLEEKYGKLLPDWPKVLVDGGEGAKSLSGVEKLYGEFLKAGVDKSWLVVGIGGGTLCDMVGFAASTWLRGLRLGLVPTTLLAQVDAGTGGKNGVNFGGFKNQVGTIYQPEFVICDPLFLETVPEREIRSGFAEIIKAGFIADSTLIEILENQKEKVLSLKGEVFEEVLYRALKVKAEIVQIDEMEKGDRVKLNFGHTIGHGIEAQGKFTHGEAVSIGMAAEAHMSRKLGFFSSEGVERVKKLLKDFNLPVEYAGSADKVLSAMKHDKKKAVDLIKTAVLHKAGVSTVEAVNFKTVEEELYDLCGNR